MGTFMTFKFEDGKVTGNLHTIEGREFADQEREIIAMREGLPTDKQEVKAVNFLDNGN